MQLEPFLETVVDALEDFVVQDLPFLAEERAQPHRFFARFPERLPPGPVSEKLRRVFEALQVEIRVRPQYRGLHRDLPLELNGSPTKVTHVSPGPHSALLSYQADGAETPHVGCSRASNPVSLGTDLSRNGPDT